MSQHTQTRNIHIGCPRVSRQNGGLIMPPLPLNPSIRQSAVMRRFGGCSLNWTHMNSERDAYASIGQLCVYRTAMRLSDSYASEANLCFVYILLIYIFKIYIPFYIYKQQLLLFQPFSSHPTPHAEKSFRNLIKPNRNQIVFTIFRLIWNSKRTLSVCCSKSIGKW